VIGVTVNHENLTDEQLAAAIDAISLELGVAVTDPLTQPLSRLVDMVLQAFPELSTSLLQRSA
jgi:uncharacterized NAD-dependent epimerase/dehydratase family protein